MTKVVSNREIGFIKAVYPFYVVTYYIKWVTTSWTYSINVYKPQIKHRQHRVQTGQFSCVKLPFLLKFYLYSHSSTEEVAVSQQQCYKAQLNPLFHGRFSRPIIHGGGAYPNSAVRGGKTNSFFFHRGIRKKRLSNVTNFQVWVALRFFEQMSKKFKIFLY